ncbi:short-chain dehydrogenase [Halorubrum persicum]|uniref:Short-chain dehydrogenase n=1 Tax=Halorubrum persicum TaxID=1383844 RepID=A0A2G1WKX4_9EURY|nr:oxidoreductase [Halorubrum persicum]PHQ39642.1 short-chain dehydrogenase [Halorubrum persicum]
MSGWTTEAMPRLDGNTVVVTGANSGLGYEGTRAFAAKGATVVMACRSVERAEAAADELRAEAGGEVDGDLDVRECDLASLDSVAEFAEGLRAEYDAVDVLCNNAGVMAIPRSETDDGFETQFGVNHLGHFALTGRLFPLLTDAEGVGGDARVVTQSSGAHESGEMDFSDLNWEESYGKWKAYGRSKLANLLFAYELQRRIDAATREGDADPGVRSVACHPGYADTNLQLRTAAESGSRLMTVGMRLANAVLGQDAATGALPMLYAATADVDGGAYVEPGGLMNMRGAPTLGRSNDASYDREDARRLWEYSTEATGVEYPL